MATRMTGGDRGRQLLAVARGIIDDEGPAALTMERVAARAGVSKPVVYRHFGNRNQLVRALLEQSWRDLDDAIAQRVATATGPADRVRASFSAFLDHTSGQGPSFQALVSSVASDPEVEAVRKARWRDQEGKWAAGFRGQFQLPAATADAAAAVLHGALAGAIGHAGRSAESRQEAEEVFITALFATLRALASRTGGG